MAEILNKERVCKFCDTRSEVTVALFCDGMLGLCADEIAHPDFPDGGLMVRLVKPMAHLGATGSVAPGRYAVRALELKTLMAHAESARIENGCVCFLDSAGSEDYLVLDASARTGVERWGLSAEPARNVPSRTLRNHPREGVVTEVWDDDLAASIRIDAFGLGWRLLVGDEAFGSNKKLVYAIAAAMDHEMFEAMASTCDEYGGDYFVSIKQRKSPVRKQKTTESVGMAKKEEKQGVVVGTVVVQPAGALEADVAGVVEAADTQEAGQPVEQLLPMELPVEEAPVESAKAVDDIAEAVAARDVERLKSVFDTEMASIGASQRRATKAVAGLVKVQAAVMREISKGQAAGEKAAYEKAVSEAKAKMQKRLKDAIESED